MVINPETSTDWQKKLEDVIAAYELLARTGNVAIANRVIQLSSLLYPILKTIRYFSTNIEDCGAHPCIGWMLA